MNNFVSDMLSVIAERGRNLVAWPMSQQSGKASIVDLSHALLSEKGEASSIAIASEVFAIYDEMSDNQRLEYFHVLAKEFSADMSVVKHAVLQFLKLPSDDTAIALHVDTEPRRQELFRRLNHAPTGTSLLVRMRQDLLTHLIAHPELKNIDQDFQHLFSSWFNRGFLVLQRITWATPATILEKIIEHEAVHEIDGWEELRRRLQPTDRRCYAFFHPALMDDPLIFVEVALTHDVVKSVELLLAVKREPVERSKMNTAVFYSISNCQKGLKNVSFGSFLIKQVVEELARELPQIKTFATLSPIPDFMSWLTRKPVANDPEDTIISKAVSKNLERFIKNKSDVSVALINDLEKVLLPLAAYYFTNVKNHRGKPIDAVARFHLGNGAKLESLNWAADISDEGLAQSAGIMVNYLYEPTEIEKNHQIYENKGDIIVSASVTKLLKKRPTRPEATQ